jgi:hypothetical protein
MIGSEVVAMLTWPRPLVAGALSALLILSFDGSVEAKTTQMRWNKSTTKGRSFVVAEQWDVHRDCSVRAYPVPKVILAPKHGKIRSGRGKITLGGRHKRDPYYRCSPVVVQGVKLHYTPAPGFTGKDFLKIQTRYSTGDVHVIEITVNVR